jgi:MFS family permease
LCALGAMVLFWTVPQASRLSGSAPAPAPARRWRPYRDGLFLIFGAATFLLFATRWGSQRTLVPITMADAGVAVEVLGLAFAAGALVTVVGGIFTGSLVDRIGSERPMIFGTALLAVALPGFTLIALLPASLFAAMVVFGAAEAFIDAATLTGAYGRATSVRGSAGAIAYLRMFGDVGTVVGPIALGAMAVWTSNEFVLWLNAAVLMSAALLIMALLRPARPRWRLLRPR